MRETRQKIYVATKVPPKNRIWPAQRRNADLRSLPVRLHHRVRRREPREPAARHHRPAAASRLESDEWIDDDEWRRAFDDLKSSGKVRAVGISINDHEPDSALDIIRTGADRHRPGDLQHLRPDAGTQSLPAGQRRTSACWRACRSMKARSPATSRPTRTSRPAISANFTSRAIASSRSSSTWTRCAKISAPPSPPRHRPALLPFASRRFDVIPGMRTVRHVESNTALSDQGPLPGDSRDSQRHAWDRNFYS